MAVSTWAVAMLLKLEPQYLLVKVVNPAPF